MNHPDNPDSNVLYPELALEILERYVRDQKMRAEAYEDSSKWDPEVDKDNTDWLKKTVEKVGWPTISKVGKDASHKAWLLVQHAADADFQKHCLELMKAEAKGEVKPQNIAYLEDRIRSFAGETQIYGTQFHTEPGSTKLVPYPIEDPENLDERRAAIGLEPFADYEKHMMEKYQK